VFDAAALAPGCGASSPGILPTCIAAAVSPASSVVAEKLLIVSEDLTALIVRQNADIGSDANTCVTISRSNRRQWLQQQQHGFITLLMDKLIISVKDLIKTGAMYPVEVESEACRRSNMCNNDCC